MGPWCRVTRGTRHAALHGLAVPMPRYRAPAPTHWLHALDLGKRKVAVATALADKGVAHLCFADTIELETRNWTAEAMAEAVSVYIDSLGRAIPEALVCEWPVKYDLRRDTHSDIEDLQQVGAAISRLRGRRFAKQWTPGSWKGGVAKDVHWRRNQRALLPGELDLIQAWLRSRGRHTTWLQSEDAHDTQDAIGIALYALGRVRRGGLLP